MSSDNNEKKSETLSFRVPSSLYLSIGKIAKADRRKLSEVALALLERGLSAYQRDGVLFEDSLRPSVLIKESKAVIDPFIGKGSTGRFNQQSSGSLQLENPPYQDNVQEIAEVESSTIKVPVLKDKLNEGEPKPKQKKRA